MRRIPRGRPGGELLEEVPRLVPLAARHQEQRHPLPRLTGIGVFLHKRLVDRHRLGPPAEQLEGDSRLQAGVEVAGPQPHGFAIPGQRCHGIVGRRQHAAEVVMGLGIARRQFGRPFERRGGLGEAAAGVEEASVGRLPGDRCVEGRKRRGGATLLDGDGGQEKGGLDVTGIAGDVPFNRP